MKPQTVRLLDVILIGPLMLGGGVVLSRAHRGAGLLLGALGAGTVLYNARNLGAAERAGPRRVSRGRAAASAIRRRRGSL